jgi:hypothetical protein
LATVEPATPPPTTTIRFLSAISSRTGPCKWRQNDPQCVPMSVSLSVVPSVSEC